MPNDTNYYQRPVNNRIGISSNFGIRKDPVTGEPNKPHGGIDFKAPFGSSIYAAADGKVIRVLNNKDFGKTVIVEHPNGEATLYAHLSDIQVNEGDSVSAGSQIALSGHSGGRSVGNHLHFEVIPADKVDQVRKENVESPNDIGLGKFSLNPDSRRDPGELLPHTIDGGTDDSSSSAPFSLDNLFSSVGEGIDDLFSSIGSGISGVFSGVGNILTASIGQIVNNLPGLALQALAARFGGGGAVGLRDTSFDNNDNGTYLPGGGNSINQILLPSAFGLAQAILRSKRSRMEGDLIDILTGSISGSTGRGGRITTPPYFPDFGNGTPPFVIDENPGGSRRGGMTTPPIVPDGSGATLYSVLGGAFDNLIGAAFNRHRTRTTSQQSDRSREASRNWNMSQSQQQAMLAQWVQRGNRNL